MASVVVAGGSVAGVGARRLPSRISRSDKVKKSTRELKEHREVKTVPEAGGQSGGGVQY
jgi:hypothetical protein